MKRTLFAALAALAAAPAAIAAGGDYRLDRAPIDPTDVVSLQAGARTFANYCLNCHGAQFMRYNRLTDIGLTTEQIRDNLMPVGDKVGDTMRVAMPAADAKSWFGVVPPDLSVIARSRGADWLYTYLRTFYRDPKSPTGWNNAAFPQVAMPHVMWTLQGERGYERVETKDKDGHVTGVEHKWTQLTPGSQTAVQYDATARDLVNFLVYVGEPSALSRKRIGIWVLFVLGILFCFAYALKREYWKDVH
jgi:ubiquinol-cytochrome c reductase cytochrome c1 subunit